jgi:L-asparaginase
MLGQVDGDGVHFHRALDAGHTAAGAFADLPDELALKRVDILYSYLGTDDAFVRAAVEAGAAGLVSAGFAPGLVTPSVRAALERLADGGFPVVMCSRAHSGRVAYRHRLQAHAGMIAGGDLTPQKARILLLLCLSQGLHPVGIREIFSRI